MGLITIASFPSSMASQPDYLCLSILVTEYRLGRRDERLRNREGRDDVYITEDEERGKIFMVEDG